MESSLDLLFVVFIHKYKTVKESNMKKLLIASILAIALVGCGSTTKTYETVENNITVDEPYPIPDGLAVIVDGATDSTITTDVENQTITIDCGGSCGDITIGAPVPQGD